MQNPACMEPDGGDGPCLGYQAMMTMRDEQTAIVARVWKALGITRYEQAKGKAIDELVAEVVEKAWRYDQCSK